jgi:hypothetical protein
MEIARFPVKLPNAEGGNLRNNPLSGEITIDFNLLPRLNVLDAGSNMLSGAIPPGLMWCTELRTLSFAWNKLRGSYRRALRTCDPFRTSRLLTMASLTCHRHCKYHTTCNLIQQTLRISYLYGSL